MHFIHNSCYCASNFTTLRNSVYSTNQNITSDEESLQLELLPDTKNGGINGYLSSDVDIGRQIPNFVLKRCVSTVGQMVI